MLTKRHKLSHQIKPTKQQQRHQQINNSTTKDTAAPVIFALFTEIIETLTKNATTTLRVFLNVSMCSNKITNNNS